MGCVIKPSWTLMLLAKPICMNFCHTCSAVIAGAALGGGGAQVALMIGMVTVAVTGVDGE